MSCRTRVVPALFAHVNLLLAVLGGCGAVTAARLKWDPSAYVPLREAFPREYRAAAALLTAGSAALLLLGHLAALALALAPSPHKRRILIVYAGCMCALMAAEAGAAAWLAARAAAWLRSAQADEVREALALRHHLRPLLDLLARWHPLPDRVKELIDEAEADVPRNGYVACAAVALLAALQVTAVGLAALAASGAAARGPRRPRRTDSLSWASAGSDDVTSDKAPLRAVYKNGRLVLV